MPVGIVKILTSITLLVAAAQTLNGKVCAANTSVTTSSGAAESITLGFPIRPVSGDPRDAPSDTLSIALEELRFLPLFSPDAKGKLRNMLAKSCVATTPTQWTVRLRKGIHFKNGKEITANDVVANYQNILIGTDAENVNKRRSFLKNVTKISKIAEYELQFSLAKPDPEFTSHLRIGTLPQEALNLPREDLVGMGFESGPFSAIRITGDEWILQRNEQFSNQELSAEKPFFRLITLKFIPDSASRVQSLTKGKLDIVMDGFSKESIHDISKNHSSKIEIRKGISPEILSLGFNFSGGILTENDIKNRILSSIDFNKIERFSLSGMVAKTEKSRAYLDSSFSETFQPNAINNNGTHKSSNSNNAKPLSIIMETIPNSLEILAAKAIAADLQKLGIETTLRVVDDDVLQKHIKSGDCPIFLERISTDEFFAKDDTINHVARFSIWNKMYFVAVRKSYAWITPTFEGRLQFLASPKGAPPQ